MKKRVLAMVLAGVMAVALAGCGGGASGGSKIPKKIEVQLPASAGGGTDVVARSLTGFINNQKKTNMTIVNNTDGSGVVAMETVRNAKKDGSTLLFFHTTMCIKTATGVYDHTGHEDFKVIAAGLPTNKGGNILVTRADSGITNVDEFVAAAKEKELLIGIETGGSTHLQAGMLSKALGINMKYVEAGADTDKLTALVGGSIDCALVNANQAKQYLEAGKVNGLACMSATDEGGRNSALPDIPSFKEQGYDGCVFGTYFYVLGNKDMDDATAKEIRDMFAAAAADPETKKVLEGTGMACEFAPFEEANGIMKAQQEGLNEVVAALGLKK